MIVVFMREDEGMIEDVIEFFLFVNGYLERIVKGRIVMFKIYAFLKIFILKF